MTRPPASWRRSRASVDGALTVALLAERITLSEMSVRRALDILAGRHQVQTVGRDTGISPRRYYKSLPTDPKYSRKWEPEVEA